MRRFGWTVVVTSLLATGFALVVYERNPTTPLQPRLIAHDAAGMQKAAPQSGTGATTVRPVLDDFVAALERHDDAALQAVFPAVTTRDARILRSVRERLGEAAHLQVSSLRLVSATTQQVEAEFVILATGGRQNELRLPFVATIARQEDTWKIVALH